MKFCISAEFCLKKSFLIICLCVHVFVSLGSCGCSVGGNCSVVFQHDLSIKK